MSGIRAEVDKLRVDLDNLLLRIQACEERHGFFPCIVPPEPSATIEQSQAETWESPLHGFTMFEDMPLRIEASNGRATSIEFDGSKWVREDAATAAKSPPRAAEEKR